jgi:tetratricopeptide (TPR) repeat protein
MKARQIIAAVLVAIMTLVLLAGCDNRPELYDKAQEHFDEGRWEEAAEIFEELGEYRDSSRQLSSARREIAAEADRVERYTQATADFERGEFYRAAGTFESLGDYRDSVERAAAARLENEYKTAVEMQTRGDYEDAIVIFERLGDFRDCVERAAASRRSLKYEEAVEHFDAGRFAQAAPIFEELGDYEDSKRLAALSRSSITFNEWFSRANFSGGRMRLTTARQLQVSSVTIFVGETRLTIGGEMQITINSGAHVEPAPGRRNVRISYPRDSTRIARVSGADRLSVASGYNSTTITRVDTPVCRDLVYTADNVLIYTITDAGSRTPDRIVVELANGTRLERAL